MQRLEYKKVIGFTNHQKESLKKLEYYGININQFIRAAVKEKISREWRTIREKKEKIKMPF